jgi:hypothetical protein
MHTSTTVITSRSRLATASPDRSGAARQPHGWPAPRADRRSALAGTGDGAPTQPRLPQEAPRPSPCRPAGPRTRGEARQPTPFDDRCSIARCIGWLLRRPDASSHRRSSTSTSTAPACSSVETSADLAIRYPCHQLLRSTPKSRWWSRRTATRPSTPASSPPPFTRTVHRDGTCPRPPSPWTTLPRRASRHPGVSCSGDAFLNVPTSDCAGRSLKDPSNFDRDAVGRRSRSAGLHAREQGSHKG